MDDLGKILYEMHLESIRGILSLQKDLEDYMLPWENLQEDAKQAWRNTATSYGKWIGS